MKSVSKVITGSIFGAILFLSLGITSEGEVGEVLRGRAVFVKNYVACHSINAKGNVVGGSGRVKSFVESFTRSSSAPPLPTDFSMGGGDSLCSEERSQLFTN